MPPPDEPASSSVKRALKTLGWVLQSFGPLVSFYVILKIWGLLPAIVTGLVIGAALVAFEIWRERKVSTLTLFTALSVAVFGALDLKFQTGFFIKLEPALGNVVTGLFFLGTVVAGQPLICEIAEKQGEALTARARAYLRKLTIVWGLFFFVRAAGYVWMAYHLTLERALVIRGILGPVSFGALFALELGYRSLRHGKAGIDARSPAGLAAPAGEP